MIYDVIYSLLVFIEKLMFFNKTAVRVYYILNSNGNLKHTWPTVEARISIFINVYFSSIPPGYLGYEKQRKCQPEINHSGAFLRSVIEKKEFLFRF